VAFLTGSPADIAIIMVVALLLFGPKKLPEIGKQLGQAMREFRKMTEELTGAAHSVRDEVESVWHAPQTGGSQEHHAISSPTVEAATTHKPYDQEPEDLMAPVVPDTHHDGRLLTPPAPEHSEDASVKGH
jgi:sec-independent protein translocase protein TatA